MLAELLTAIGDRRTFVITKLIVDVDDPVWGGGNKRLIG
jgi:hypothetical protein